jgi:hypothetical protein
MRIAPLIPIALLAACSTGPRLRVPVAVADVVPPAAAEGMEWRAVAVTADRTRLRNWRKTWVETLDAVRPAASAQIAAEGKLFDPDLAVEGPIPTPGPYRCRWFKLGSIGRATDPFVAVPAQRCTVWTEGATGGIRFEDGVQRPVAMLLPESTARAMALGSMMLAEEQAPHAYGRDPLRDIAGYIERIDQRRWRLVIPEPRFESRLDVIDIVPASD